MMYREEKEVVKYYFPHCQLLLLYGEDDYFISAGNDYFEDEKTSGQDTNNIGFRLAKKVYKQFVDRYKTKVQKATFRSMRQNDNNYIYYGYSDEENDYGDYVDVVFPTLPKSKKTEIPKKCQRPDVCYIMKLCIFCKPYFKKQL